MTIDFTQGNERKKIVDRTDEAGIESQCQQLLIPARPYQACSSQKNRLTRSVFLCPKSHLRAETIAPAVQQSQTDLTTLKLQLDRRRMQSTFFLLMVTPWCHGIPDSRAALTLGKHVYKQASLVRSR